MMSLSHEYCLSGHGGRRRRRRPRGGPPRPASPNLNRALAGPGIRRDSESRVTPSAMIRLAMTRDYHACRIVQPGLSLPGSVSDHDHPMIRAVIMIMITDDHQPETRRPTWQAQSQ